VSSIYFAGDGVVRLLRDVYHAMCHVRCGGATGRQFCQRDEGWGLQFLAVFIFSYQAFALFLAAPFLVWVDCFGPMLSLRVLTRGFISLYRQKFVLSLFFFFFLSRRDFA
jgi:hypothetical protein